MQTMPFFCVLAILGGLALIAGAGISYAFQIHPILGWILSGLTLIIVGVWMLIITMPDDEEDLE